GHEPGALDGVLDGALEGGAVAAALAAEELALAGAQLLERLHVLVIDERRPRAALLGAEPAAVFPSPPELLANHSYPHLSWRGGRVNNAGEPVRMGGGAAAVNRPRRAQGPGPPTPPGSVAISGVPAAQGEMVIQLKVSCRDCHAVGNLARW